jgi:hypothetical protein
VNRLYGAYENSVRRTGQFVELAGVRRVGSGDREVVENPTRPRIALVNDSLQSSYRIACEGPVPRSVAMAMRSGVASVAPSCNTSPAPRW